jgi:hypothetical protein
LAARDAIAPVPLLTSGQPVNWWFVFKFNTRTYPECGGAERTCLFGGSVQPYTSYGQQFAFASSLDGTLQQGGGCVGDTTTDPLGATFAQVYNGNFYYVLWNDNGDGVVLQVSTPSWPVSGSSSHPRKTDGNTLGCILDDNVLVSQHFFALIPPRPSRPACSRRRRSMSTPTRLPRPTRCSIRWAQASRPSMERRQPPP